MDIKILHFYPDLMSLYGSYANVSVLKRALEAMGNTVTIETVAPGQEADVAGADVLFMGAGTERAQKAALKDFARFGEAVKAAAESGAAMLFCGTAMELLGKTITDAEGNTYDGIALAGFTATQGKKRLVEDVYGHTTLYAEPVVGFMNKCSVLSGVETPLLTDLELGYGNDGEKTAGVRPRIFVPKVGRGACFLRLGVLYCTKAVLATFRYLPRWHGGGILQKRSAL